MSFLDDNCIIFDTEDENKLEYTEVHNVISSIRSNIIEFQEISWRSLRWVNDWVRCNEWAVLLGLWESKWEHFAQEDSWSISGCRELCSFQKTHDQKKLWA